MQQKQTQEGIKCCELLQSYICSIKNTWVSHSLPLSSLLAPPLRPSHSTGAEDRRLSCPHTDNCSDDFSLSCTWTRTPPAADWLEKCCVAPFKPLCLHAHLQSQSCVWTLAFFFSVHTKNRQLADCEEIFAVFEKKKAYWLRITDLPLRF